MQYCNVGVPVDDTLMGKKYCVRNTRRLFFHLVKKGNYKVLAAPPPPFPYSPHSLLLKKKEKIIIVCLRSPERLWALSFRKRRSVVVVVIVIVIVVVTGLVSLMVTQLTITGLCWLPCVASRTPVERVGDSNSELWETSEANNCCSRPIYSYVM